MEENIKRQNKLETYLLEVVKPAIDKVSRSTESLPAAAETLVEGQNQIMNEVAALKEQIVAGEKVEVLKANDADHFIREAVKEVVSGMNLHAGLDEEEKKTMKALSEHLYALKGTERQRQEEQKRTQSLLRKCRLSFAALLLVLLVFVANSIRYYCSGERWASLAYKAVKEMDANYPEDAYASVIKKYNNTGRRELRKAVRIKRRDARKWNKEKNRYSRIIESRFKIKYENIEKVTPDRMIKGKDGSVLLYYRLTYVKGYATKTQDGKALICGDNAWFSLSSQATNIEETKKEIDNENENWHPLTQLEARK